jgi:hypothetical protein
MRGATRGDVVDDMIDPYILPPNVPDSSLTLEILKGDFQRTP